MVVTVGSMIWFVTLFDWFVVLACSQEYCFAPYRVHRYHCLPGCEIPVGRKDGVQMAGMGLLGGRSCDSCGIPHRLS